MATYREFVDLVNDVFNDLSVKSSLDSAICQNTADLFDGFT
jgi:hypothetical protein